MTKISQYSIDVNITGNDKWIGSDAQNYLITKNFTPNNLANYFNGNNVIDIGTSIRYKYQTLDPGEAREQGTISFETEIGPQVNFSAITTFLIAKNSLKQNDVSQYLDFLVDGKVLLSKASNINVFGYYKITSLQPWIPNTNFFVVTVDFLAGNGFIYEDLDYLVSLVDKAQDVITPTLQSVVNAGNGISNFGGIGVASIQSTNFTNNRTLYLNDNSYPTIRLVDNGNSSHNLTIDLDTISLNGTSYNWSDIVSGVPQDLQQVTDIGNTTTNDIQFINSAEAIFGAGGGILLDNGSRLREGTIDAGLGGSKGISQICAVGYELKWEAGRLYVMDGNGVYIRLSLYNFNITPTINDDVTKGYLNGSRWTLDNGDVYECTDDTTGAAVWELQLTDAQNLQNVTDIGNTSTNDIVLNSTVGKHDDYTAQNTIRDIGSALTYLGGTPDGDWYTNYDVQSFYLQRESGSYSSSVSGTNGILQVGSNDTSNANNIGVATLYSTDGAGSSYLQLYNKIAKSGYFKVTNLANDVTLQFPNKSTGTYTIATTADIPTVGTWGALNYPTWTTGTPFVKMTAAGTFALDTTTYLSSITSSDVTTALGYTPVTNARTLTINGVGYDLTADRSWTIATGSGTVTSVGLTMPSAFTVTNSPITSSGDIAVTGAGLVSQYVRGDGTLANFPNSTGGGSSVNYYLNGSVSQGTFGGTTYYQMSKTPILGAGTNFKRTNGAGNGYIASFITDAGDPSFLNIPGGNWNLEFYFQSSSTGGSPQFYGEIYKVNASNVFTLVASGSANPEGITNGTTVDQYFTSISVPQTSLLITDRLAVRIYVITSGRTITLHTENGNLCEVLTTFTTGLTALNGLTQQVQYFTVGTGATNLNIVSSGDTHTFNLLSNIRRNANNSTNNNINYCGYAVTGSAESSAVWTITRLTISASGAITVGTATNVAWTNRESATYI